MLKPFIPQLQTTFTKALNDPTRVVQSYAATALSALIVISTKVDPIITELLSSINQSEGPAQESMLFSLTRFNLREELFLLTQPIEQQILLKVGSSVNPDLMGKVGDSLIKVLGTEEDATRVLLLQNPLEHTANSSMKANWRRLSKKTS